MRSLTSAPASSVSSPQIDRELNWWQWLTESATADDTGHPRRDAHQVYRHNLYACAARTLALVFPAVCVALGKQNFEHLAAEYAGQYLPQHRDLNRYGAGFPRWLRAHPQWPRISVDLPFLASLLAFEWAWHRAYHADLQARFDVAEFERQAGQRPAEILFLLDPALSLVAARFDINSIRRQLLECGACEYAPAAASAAYWVIWPGQWQVCLAGASENERQLLRRLQAREPWGDWLDKIPGSVLQDGIARSWIVGCADIASDLSR